MRIEAISLDDEVAALLAALTFPSLIFAPAAA